MSAKKAKGRVKAAPKKSTAKTEAAKAKTKGKDIVEVREDINELVKNSATKIATSVIDVATRTGQLASAKYLFESVGIYPAPEQAEARANDVSLAQTLLTRMGLPLEPVVRDEDEEPTAIALVGSTKAAAAVPPETAAEEKSEADQASAQSEE